MAAEASQGVETVASPCVGLLPLGVVLPEVASAEG